VREQPYAAVFMRTGMAFTAEEMEALAELFAEDVVWHTQAATRSQASLRDALPPLRHWPKSSSFGRHVCRGTPPCLG
jgi:hypothetical protein